MKWATRKNLINGEKYGIPSMEYPRTSLTNFTSFECLTGNKVGNDKIKKEFQFLQLLCQSRRTIINFIMSVMTYPQWDQFDECRYKS